MELSNLKKEDPEIYQAIEKEKARQMDGLELIPSENFVSKAVLEATGSILTNKYAEGYPGKRYYGGCEFIDVAEQLAIDRVKKLFNCDHANVQPHSGSSANMAAYMAALQPGQKIMGLDLYFGGHLTHGYKTSFSSKFYVSTPYTLNKETELIDFDQIRMLAKKEKPNMIVAGATAYPREFDFKQFREVADEVGALLMCDIAHIAGLVIAGVHQSPIPYAHIVTTTTHKTLRGPRGGVIMCKSEFAQAVDKTIIPGMQGGPLEHVIAAKAVCFKEAMKPEFKQYGKQIVKNSKALANTLMENGFKLVTNGTDNHLMLINFGNNGLTGKEAEGMLGEAGITVNKNTVPYDTRSPLVGSGVRLGTPAITTMGMKENEMKIIGNFITKVLKNPSDNALRKKIRQEVKELCGKFNFYD